MNLKISKLIRNAFKHMSIVILIDNRKPGYPYILWRMRDNKFYEVFLGDEGTKVFDKEDLEDMINFFLDKFEIDDEKDKEFFSILW